jgi:hypothetical protein
MRPSCPISVCVFCLLCSAVCSAQKAVSPAECTGPLIQNVVDCAGPHGCKGQIVYDTGGEGDYITTTVTTRSCCGQLFSSLVPTGDCDSDGLLKDQATKDEVGRAAKESAVLVADCRGHYVPYDVVSAPRSLATPPSKTLERR